MTGPGPTEFAAAMQRIANDRTLDIEERHQAQDMLMCETLANLGYDRGVTAYRGTHRWYKTWRKVDIAAVIAGIALLGFIAFKLF